MPDIKFPEILYVHRSFGTPSEAPFEGYVEYETAEDGDTVGVYVRQAICLVKETKTKSLEPLEASDAGEV